MRLHTPVLPLLDPAIIRRQLGISPQLALPDTLIETACMQVQEKATPRGSWEIYPFDAETDSIVSLPPLSVAMLPGVPLLAGSHQVALVAVTLGSVLSTYAADKLNQGDYTNGLLVNAAAKCALDICATQVIAALSQHAGQLGYSIGNHIILPADLSFFPINDFLLLCGGAKLTLSCVDDQYLTPSYSLLSLVGLHPYQFRLNLPATASDFSSASPELKCQARK
ncbi:MAG TPA: hypothetical protein VN611_06910 [Patescibacteria group bacterium]|nr:hypothetical protein [Patescibacteria group bacterium]